MGRASREQALAVLWIAAVVTACIALAWQLSPEPSNDATAASTGDTDSAAQELPLPEREGSRDDPAPIVLQPTTRAAGELDPVRVTGTYPDVPPGTKLVVQWQREGEWVAFPLPAAVLATGRFSTYVQLGEEGRHRLRVVDTSAGTASNAITLWIR